MLDIVIPKPNINFQIAITWIYMIHFLIFFLNTYNYGHKKNK